MSRRHARATTTACLDPPLLAMSEVPCRADHANVSCARIVNADLHQAFVVRDLNDPTHCSPALPPQTTAFVTLLPSVPYGVFSVINNARAATFTSPPAVPDHAKDIPTIVVGVESEVLDSVDCTKQASVWTVGGAGGVLAGVASLLIKSAQRKRKQRVCAHQGLDGLDCGMLPTPSGFRAAPVSSLVLMLGGALVAIAAYRAWRARTYGTCAECTVERRKTNTMHAKDYTWSPVDQSSALQRWLCKYAGVQCQCRNAPLERLCRMRSAVDDDVATSVPNMATLGQKKQYECFCCGTSPGSSVSACSRFAEDGTWQECTQGS